MKPHPVPVGVQKVSCHSHFSENEWLQSEPRDQNGFLLIPQTTKMALEMTQAQ